MLPNRVSSVQGEKSGRKVGMCQDCVQLMLDYWVKTITAKITDLD